MLDALLGGETEPDTYSALQAAYRIRQETLGAKIRAGDFDDPDRERELLAYLVLETKNRVRIAAPNELKE
jgi:hypothetical protein